MRKLFWKNPSFILLLLFASLFVNCIFLIHAYRQHIIVSVPDGDSLQLADGRRIRLIGLDAPERGLCAASDARMTLEVAAKGKHVRLKHIVTDDYGRQLAHVIVEDFPTWISYMRHRVDPHLNRLMISHGLAKFNSSKDEYYETLKAAQTDAKEHALGIWSETCRSTKNPECPIKGNIRAGKKTYLLKGCKNYDQTIIDTSFGDRWFCTEEEATNAGFSRASGCAK